MLGGKKKNIDVKYSKLTNIYKWNIISFLLRSITNIYCLHSDCLVIYNIYLFTILLTCVNFIISVNLIKTFTSICLFRKKKVYCASIYIPTILLGTPRRGCFKFIEIYISLTYAFLLFLYVHHCANARWTMACLNVIQGNNCRSYKM